MYNPSKNKHVVLVHEKAPQFIIVTALDASKTVTEAVEELNYWIHRITGVTLPVTSVPEWDGVTPYIAVGSSTLTLENGWDQGEFKQEEARVFIEPGQIGLLGNDESPYKGVTWKGTYYAVLEFVRKALGVRWIWPGELGEVFAKRRTLAVHPGAWTWAPHLPTMRLMGNAIRSTVIANRADDFFGIIRERPETLTALEKLEGEQARWLNRQRMNRSSNIRFGHSFPDWWERFGQDHPDWFALPPDGMTQFGGRGVQLNLSSPQVHDKLIDQWENERAKDSSRAKVLPIAPNDSRGYDTRPETRAWDAPEMNRFSDQEIYNDPKPILTDRHLKFWNIIARRAKAVDPDVKVTSYAYRNYQAPPLGDEQVEDNVIIAYVGGEGYYPDESHIRDEWVNWLEKGAQLLWRPNLLHTGHGTPYLFSRMLFEDFRFFQQHDMLGTHFDSLTGNWAGQGLTYYVLTELHFRPDVSYHELAEEYFAAFGPAAHAIRAYHEFFEKKTVKIAKIMRDENFAPRETWGDWWIAHIRIIPRFLTPAVVRHAESLLRKAKQAAQKAEPEIRERVRVIENGFQHAKLMAEAFRALRLDEPKARVSYHGEAVREALKPLWDFRMEMVTNYLIPVLRYLTEEERRLGIWGAFRKSTENDSSGTATLSLDLSSGWDVRSERDFDRKEIVEYQLEFDVPVQADTGERYFLTLNSAVARAWLNGYLIYEHGGNSLIPDHPIEVSTIIKDGTRNMLVIRGQKPTSKQKLSDGTTMRIQRC